MEEYAIDTKLGDPCAEVLDKPRGFYICSVKRAIPMLFLLVFLLANTAFEELLRLPVLVHHYLEHRDLNNQSLADFISEHYTGKINHPDDQHHDHERLPFKATTCTSAHLVTAVPQTLFSFSDLLPVVSGSPNAGYTRSSYANACLESIWQPPRLS